MTDHSKAPVLLYADEDYEVGDGTTGLHESKKRASGIPIKYVRKDVHDVVAMQRDELAAHYAVAYQTIERLSGERDQALAMSAAAALDMRERSAKLADREFDYWVENFNDSERVNWELFAEKIRALTPEPDAQAALMPEDNTSTDIVGICDNGVRKMTDQSKAPDWEGFGKAVMENWQEHCDLEACELFDFAKKYLIVREISGGFDPENHIDVYGYSEPGDPWFEENW